MDDKEILQIKKRAEDVLLKIPGVHSVGIGAKETGGKPTGEICIKVYVVRKKPEEEIRVEERIPREIDGIITDVNEAPIPTILQTAGARPPFLEDEGRYRPLRGGIQIGRSGMGFGTLGCFFTVQDNPNLILGVTNHHVVNPRCSDNAVDETVGQPEDTDSCFGCCSSVIGRVLRNVCDNDLDIALIQISSGQEWLAEVQQMGFITGGGFVTAADAATLTYQVRKRGRTTGLTGGVVEAVELSGVINNHDGTLFRNYDHVMRIRPNPDGAGAGTAFSAPGDSGSAIVNESGQIVGIHFGGGAGAGLSIPLDLIVAKFDAMAGADRLQLRVATATTNNDVRVVPIVRAEPDLERVETPLPVNGIGQELEKDLSRTPTGQWVLETYLRHAREVRELINGNRRVATVWHRSGAAELLQSLVNVVRRPEERVPDRIQGRSIPEILVDMKNILTKFGSLKLMQDLDFAQHWLPSVAGMNYAEILESIERLDHFTASQIGVQNA